MIPTDNFTVNHRTKIKYVILRIFEGLKKGWISILSLVLTIMIVNLIYWINYFSNPILIFFNINLIADIILTIIACGLALYLLGMPKGALQVEHALKKASLVNDSYEPPILLNVKRDSNKVTMIFFANGIPLKEWDDKQANVESALNINILSMNHFHRNDQVVLEAVKAEGALPELVDWDNAFLSDNVSVLIAGKGYGGNIGIDLSKTAHILIGGSTGSGKTILLKNLLFQCHMHNDEMIIGDFKGLDFEKWNQLYQCTVVTSEGDFQNLLKKAKDIMDLRRSILTKEGCTNIDEYNSIHNISDRMNRIIVSCDEVAELLDTNGKGKAEKELTSQITSILSTIARQGRAFGVHLILATQRPDATIIPGQIKNNLDCRICGRADQVLSMMLLDNNDAVEKIRKTDRGRFVTNGGALFQAYYFDEKKYVT